MRLKFLCYLLPYDNYLFVYYSNYHSMEQTPSEKGDNKIRKKFEFIVINVNEKS